MAACLPLFSGRSLVQRRNRVGESSAARRVSGSALPPSPKQLQATRMPTAADAACATPQRRSPWRLLPPPELVVPAAQALPAPFAKALTPFALTPFADPVCNLLRVSTSFTNNGSSLNLSYFDTFDPDQGTPQGLGPRTHNDVFALAGGVVGQARLDGGPIQDTVIAGSLDPRVTVASGNPFQISSGSSLNSFFASPIDGNDTYVDRGTHIGLRTLLAASETTSFSYDLAFGATAAEAQAAFVDANSVAPVPEPSSLALFGIGGCATVLARRRRLRQAR